VSRDGGQSFGPRETVSAAGRTATFPVVALRRRDLTLAWSEKAEAPAAKHSHGGGALPKVGDNEVMLLRGVVE
jgi:hypothetical protein